MPSTFPGPWPANVKQTICNFTHLPVAGNTGGNPGTTFAAVPATTINTINQWMVNGCYFEQYNTTASTAAVPIMGTLANNGINIDNVTGAAAKTIEITEGNAVSIKNAFVVGTSPAFFVRATFNVNTTADVTSLYVGFRKQQAYQATVPTGYTDYATIGVSGAAAKLQIQTQVGSGGNVTTDTTNVITALTNFTVQVNVSSAGVVTYLRDVTGNGPLIAPTAVAAYTFTGALTVIPYILYTTVTGHAEVDLVEYICGLQ
jgi:hypothetical protein